MRDNKRVSAMQLWHVAVILVLLALYGCAEEEVVMTPTSPDSYLEPSSQLADNPLPAGSDFANFRVSKITIDPSALPLSGSRIFLKLSSQSGEVLYLGEIDRFQYFDLEVSLLLDEEWLNYELFTNDLEDKTQFGVITL